MLVGGPRAARPEVAEGERLRARSGRRRGEDCPPGRKTKRTVYEFLVHVHNDPPLPGYGAFTAWCRRSGLTFGAAAAPEAHLRFETRPVRQLQLDWKEHVRIVDSERELLEFNVFTATLGYSRRHVFLPTPGRITYDLLARLLQTFRILGGVPEELVTDNMSALVTLSEGTGSAGWSRRGGSLARRGAASCSARRAALGPRGRTRAPTASCRGSRPTRGGF